MKISVSILDAVNRYEAVDELNDTNISYIHIAVGGSVLPLTLV